MGLFGSKKTGPASNGSFWRTAEHPGYKNQKQANRGGTRRSVLTGRAVESVTRNPKSKRLARQASALRAEVERNEAAEAKRKEDAAKAKRAAKKGKK